MAPDRGLDGRQAMTLDDSGILHSQIVSQNGIDYQTSYVTDNMQRLELTTDGNKSKCVTPALSELRDRNMVLPSNGNETSNSKPGGPFEFGQRFLTEDVDVFAHNAWDHVEPDAEYLSFAEAQYKLQRSSPVSDWDKSRINSAPQKWWDTFYRHKSSTFFKDRKWLFQEFPVLYEVTRSDAGKKIVLEVGAGAGNTAFPVLRLNENPELEIYAHDFSKVAVETMRQNADYTRRNREDPDPEVLGHVRSEIWDLASSDQDEDRNIPPGILAGTVDVVVMIFVFSALSPSQWQQAVKNVWRVLKPGGLVLFRDYGRGDLAQVRFKTGRLLQDNFYVRGDGTRVYFFEKEEVASIFGGLENMSEASEQVEKVGEQSGTPCGVQHRLVVLNLDVDRRLIVNRQRRIKMYRCWLQGRFQKPAQS